MSVTDSDTESTVSSQSRPTTAKTTKSPSQQVFPFAHPPPKSTSCFRFTSRLLLQIQQLLSASRALPILEIYRPSSLGKSIPGCPSKVHSQDLYVVQSDAYQNLPASCSQSPSTDSPVVGVIYTNYCSSSSSSTNHKPASSPPSSSTSTSATTKSPPNNNSNNNNAIYLPQLQLTLLASRTSRGGYIFQVLPSSSSSPKPPQKLTLELAKKKPKHKTPPPRSSATTRTHRSSASTTPDDDDNDEECDNVEPKNQDPASFLLGIRGSTTSTASASPVDPNSGDSTRRSPRRPWLAGLSHKGIKVLRGEQQDQLRRRVLAAVGVGEERVDVLYTITLLVGIYAARMEGWV
ncbi:uncharacterized protein BO95DRAFT_437664 [Aspergillus brunneoviolaceus CBS 621.78]|uniref:Uncharacterized protein n=1 Tax=Aspergillus brunneoviolaceus CBS 621.78 TaxID=1450534 RepID=A0ACD1GQE5_9EURO|nr:hypothetical protein BO95DRAFT_437664 [Aspergillus brunneoviolaceus CBS 621.78]RAH51486.1 hypothetical protein BO95DRAFT_437664 [Aspergillus brunneoviolaceus CBS 621.78]